MSILSEEIRLDPITRGYVGMDAEALVVSMNTANRERNKTSMSGREVMNEIVNSEFNALSDARKALVVSLTSSSDLDPFGFAENVLKDIFGSSVTLTRLAAARLETINRATELGIPDLTLRQLKLESIR